MSEVVVRTLVGEFREHGSNHGRKVYKKVPDGNPEAVDVFLYYWDGRDGPSFQGWWFGNKLGGTQVWSHCVGEGLTPPSSGWKIPWDGAVRHTLSVDNKALQKRAQAMEKVFALSQEVSAASAGARRALEQATAAHHGKYEVLETLKAAEEILMPQSTALNEVLRKVVDGQRTAAGDTEVVQQLIQLGTTTRSSQSQVNAELGKIRTSKAQALNNAKAREAEVKDTQALEEMLPELQEKANAAEDAVEKAIITSDLINAAGESTEEVKNAVTQTEASVRSAQLAIGEARGMLSQKLSISKRFTCVVVRDRAQQQLAKIQAQLTEAQSKLNPLRSVRADFQQRQVAKQILNEAVGKLTPVEIECDKAAEATKTLLALGENPPKEAVEVAEAAVAKAATQLNMVLRFLGQKKAGAQGIILKEITSLEERARTFEQRLAEIRSSQKEVSEKVNCECLLKEARDKIQTVKDHVAKAADAEGPFLMGVEDLPIEDALAALKACESAATSANTAASIARMFIETKLVDAKRFSAKYAQEATAKLKELQKQLEGLRKRLAELKENSATRRKRALTRESETRVVEAESAAKAAATLAVAFEDDDKLAEMLPEDLAKATEEALKAEAEAAAKVMEGRKFIAERQIETRAAGGNADLQAELTKLSTRMAQTSGELAKLKKSVSSAGERLQARHLVKEVRDKVAAFGVEADAAAEKVDALGEASVDSQKEVVEAAVGALAACASAGKALNVQLVGMMQRQGPVRTEVQALQAKMKGSQEKLNAAHDKIKGLQQRLEVRKIISESEEKLGVAEQSLKTATDAEAVFKEKKDVGSDGTAVPTCSEVGGEATKSDEAGEGTAKEDADKAKASSSSGASGAPSVEALMKAIQEASMATAAARTYITMKRVRIRQLAESVATEGNQALSKLQERLESVNKSVIKLKASASARRSEAAKKEVEAKIDEMKGLIEAAKQSTLALTKSTDGTDLDADAMKAVCKQAGEAQATAKKAVADASALVEQKQKEARSSAEPTGALAALAKLLEPVQRGRVELAELQQKLRDQEHAFVAQRLVKDAAEQVEKLEKGLDGASEVAAALLADDKKECFVATLYLEQIIDALRVRASSSSPSVGPEQIWDEVAEKGETLAQAKFIAFVSKLPELSEAGDALYSDEEFARAFKRVDLESTGEIKREQFLAQFQRKYMVALPVSMTDALVVKGGKTVRKLDVNEVIETLGEQEKDPGLGLLRVKARADKDGKEGYITVRGNQGTDYLSRYDPHLVAQRRADEVLKQLLDEAISLQRYIDRKVGELKGVDRGPLSESRNDILALRPKVQSVRDRQQQLMQKVVAARKEHLDVVAAEKHRREEAVARSGAKRIQDEVQGLAKEAEAAVEEALAVVSKLTNDTAAEVDDPADAFAAAEKGLVDALSICEKADAKLKERLDELKSHFQGPLADARSALNKFKVTVGALMISCRKATMELSSALVAVEAKAHKGVANALSAHVLKESLDAEALYIKLAGEAPSAASSDASADAVPPAPPALPTQQLRQLLEGLSGESSGGGESSKPPRGGRLGIALRRYSTGLSRLSFGCLAQQYARCTKEIAVTSGFDVKESKSIRKLAVGEVVEILEAERLDESGLARCHVRAIVDGKNGWATLRGNQGTDFLVPAKKPFIVCEDEVRLQEASASNSAELLRGGRARTGDILEILEGPMREDPLEIQRMQGMSTKDRKSGWVTAKDFNGNPVLEKTKVLVCRQGVALTPAFDIGEGKPLRKLECGEVLELLGEDSTDEKRAMTRCKVRARSDGLEGWVTRKGNQGTAFVEESEAHYICKAAAPLEQRFFSGSALVKMLEPGDLFEVLDGPKTETKEGASRMRGRNLSTGATGWFNGPSEVTVTWSPEHRCVQSTPLTDGLDCSSSKMLRHIQPGEVLEALDTPVSEPATGLLRVRVRCQRDGSCGFATVRNKHGVPFLESVAVERWQ